MLRQNQNRLARNCEPILVFGRLGCLRHNSKFRDQHRIVNTRQDLSVHNGHVPIAAF